jgi:hypothetical protein
VAGATVVGPGADPPSNQATVYDLTAAPQISPRYGLVIRLLCGVGILVLGGLVVAQLVLAAFRGALDSISEGDAILIGVAIGSVGVLALIVLTNSAGASKIVWNQEGFALVFRRGRVRKFRWSDPGLRIELGEVTYKGRTEYDLLTFLPSHNYVTAEVFDAMVAEAYQRGLVVTSKSYKTGETSVRTHKIRPPRGKAPSLSPGT